MARIRNFCFTLNNPEPIEIEFWEHLCNRQRLRDRHHVTYVVFQTERGPTTTNNIGIDVLGTLHYQGYVELSRAIRLPRLKTIFGDRLHIEQRRGTQAQAIAYCKKEETRVQGANSGEGGEAKKLGKDKLKVVAELIKLGNDLEGLQHDYPCTFIRNGASIRSYALRLKGQRHKAPIVHIVYGKTGTGKTHWIENKWPDAYWVPMPRNGGWWWPNYTGQKVAFFDEFANQWKYHEMLRLLDRYPFDIQEKGGNSNMISEILVFTSNIDPMNWYSGVQDKTALHRRFRDFATIYEVDNDSTWDDFKYTIREQ